MAFRRRGAPGPNHAGIGDAEGKSMARIRTRLMACGFLAGLSGAVGCLPQQTNRAQVADDSEKDANATVGMKTVVGNAEPIPVSAVGLVYNLKGTGSSPTPDGWRSMLENTLKKRKLSPKELLDDPNRTTSLVLVSGTVPPGCRNQDRFDLTITLPPGSKTGSLRNGYLEICDLTNFEAAGNARRQLTDSGIPVGKTPQASSDAVLIGNRLATGEGPLVSGQLLQVKEAKSGEDETPAAISNTGEKIAKVWNGGVCLLERPYYFLMNETASQPRLAMVIASRLNTVFHGSTDRGNKIAEAKVQSKPLVAVFVPPTYRHNHSRFLMVARQVPLVNVGPGDPYRKKLEQELVLPETALVAAVKLEALGSESEDALRVGLESNSPWVQFAAAQSLAYLGKADPTASGILAKLAERHPALRTHCLMALASQDDAHCIDQLGELMKSKDVSLRYGAFTAMRLMDENHDSVRGRKMANSFWLHTIAEGSDPLVHLITERRNEIVLFGTAWPIRGPFSFPLGTDFTVTMKDGEESVLVSRIVTKNNEPTTVEAKYRADLGYILKGIAEMGGNYGDAIEFIRRVNGADCLGAKLAVDATPRGMTIQQLASLARTDLTLARSDVEVEKINGDILQAGWEAPGEPKPLQKAPIVELELPNRNQGGRLFGPRQPETNAIGAVTERR